MKLVQQIGNMKKYFLIILTMAVAYAFSSYAGTSIFVNSTPNVNHGYLADLQNTFKKGVNNVYLAFSIFSQKPTKKNIAVVYPTLVSAKNNMSGKLGNPTSVPITTPVIAKIDPTAIPSNLFKSISKGVSAYEKDEHLYFRLNTGAKYRVGEVEVDGKKYKIIYLEK